MTDFDFNVFSWNEPPFTGLSVQASDCFEKLVFLLHGYMGDAESNLAFAEKLAARVPNARIVVPDGLMPIPAYNDSHRRQWWELDERFNGNSLAGFSNDASDFDYALTQTLVPKIHFSAGVLNRFVVNTAAKCGKTLSDCAVAGISQGGMTAFEMVLFRKELSRIQNPLGALIIIGAGIVKAERLSSVPSLPPIPVLLAGGNQDEIFPPEVNDFSEKILKEKGLPVSRIQTNSVHYGLEHSTDEAVGEFLNKIWKK